MYISLFQIDCALGQRSSKGSATAHSDHDELLQTMIDTPVK